jgi:hypothetical protein
MKVNSTVYKGIEFVEISSLPIEQKTSLLQTINPDLLIKILVDGKLMPRCLQYRHYEEWYDNSFGLTTSGLTTSTSLSAHPESRGQEVKADFQL